jgi:sec-independent protein translocase protein TatA
MVHSFQPLLLDLFNGQHLIWLFLAIIILFGGRKIPELARGIGKGIREFNDAKDGVKNEIENGMKPVDKTTTSTTTSTNV